MLLLEVKFRESEERGWGGGSDVDRLLEEGFGGGGIGLRREKKRGERKGQDDATFVLSSSLRKELETAYLSEVMSNHQPIQISTRIQSLSSIERESEDLCESRVDEGVVRRDDSDGSECGDGVEVRRIRGDAEEIREIQTLVSRPRTRWRNEENVASKTHHSNNVLFAASFSSSPPIPQSACANNTDT